MDKQTKIHKITFDLDDNGRNRLRRIIGQALMDGKELTIKCIMTGALRYLTDEQLLKFGLDVLDNPRLSPKSPSSKSNKKKRSLQNQEKHQK